MTRIIFALAALLLIGASSCEDEITSTIPYADVRIKLDLTLEDSDLKPLMSTKTITSRRPGASYYGFGGILIINAGEDASGSILYAYDLACPTEANRNYLLTPDDSGYATCKECGVKYNIFNGVGNPIAGSSGKYYLRSYKVTNTGGGTYLVTH